ncbi:MAG: type II toxin-antitoxin system HipA family toxin [Acidimicrobiia bacterium]|nr:type II toxin-antitoxin system HipA family toxin [Acidimicrobiia bacterium]MYC57780.1 type II toxin-antitoxin system HipA family toxin [Acidimicrobiia bacterium]MYI29811.1 type II toxin-antitoxin system HipA family toxin [Acidimicrobiia bacterium]
MMAELQVLIHGERAGTVSDGRNGQALFSYSDEYLARPSPVPLSTSFPLDSRPHDVEAWLDGLLADNDEVRRRWATDYGIYSTKPSDLLGTPVGRDCAGAVQFCRPEDIADLALRDSRIDPLTESDVGGIVANLRADAAAWKRSAHQLVIPRLEASERMRDLSERVLAAFNAAIETLPARAAHSTHASNLLDAIEKRAATGKAVSRSMAHND